MEFICRNNSEVIYVTEKIKTGMFNFYRFIGLILKKYYFCYLNFKNER
ncbi:MAG: hypothetical protein K0S26_996 [Bacteroidota bacterium]|nr:hypothetical protein [Bacteroidota bacterium]